ncbi:MAG TPA: AsmA-like C-terminal region-containing protein [Bryobacteraceae bacterium]|jgi:hypothetical protein
MRRALRYAVPALCLILLGGGTYLFWYLKTLGPRAKVRVERALEDRFNADVELKSLDISLFPRPAVTGEGLTIRHKDWSDSQPLISIGKFHAATDFWTLLNRRNRVDIVRLDGLSINVPPRGLSLKKEGAPPSRDTTHLKFEIKTIVANGTLLEIAPKKPGKDPLIYEIKELTLHSVGPAKAMSFVAKLTNAKPPGLIDTTGNFGPWQRDEPRSTPVSGDYVFQNADLGVFSGISGILSSKGKYQGVLERIEVDGGTSVPEFALKRGGDSVNLVTQFHSIVDGTDGDTLLQPVDAHFLSSEFVCQGGVVHQPGPKGKTVSLDAASKHARIEDILNLVVGGGTPFLTGDVNFKSKIVIPPGNQDVIDKLRLDGQFAVLSAKFASRKVQERLLTLSNRARGISKEEQQSGQGPDMVASDFRGRFKLEDGTARFSQLSFRVPGALISLAGAYWLESGKIDMHGTFRMQATLSQTQSGVKQLLLMPLNKFFEKDGAGFEAPLDITGTRDRPTIGITVLHKTFAIH